MTKTDEVEFLMETAEQMGVACATVSDGHILIFKKEHFKKLLNSFGNNDKIVIFIKRPDMQ